MTIEDQSSIFPRIATDTTSSGSFDASAYVSEARAAYPELPCGLFQQNGGDGTEAAENASSLSLAEAFEAATGWTLMFDEAPSSRRRRAKSGLSGLPSTGRIFIDDMSDKWPAGTPCVSRLDCDRLAQRISDLVNQLQLTRLELNEARSRLGASVPGTLVPISGQAETEGRLANRLSTLLETTTRTASASAAAFYVLDEDAKFLNLSAQIGFDPASSQEAEVTQRELARCTADIEALAGHAIVMASPDQAITWNSPLKSRSAICLPVASATTIIGTLWIFADQKRDYADELINILEIIAGRIAAEVECASALYRVGMQNDVSVDEEAILASIESLLSETSEMIHRNEDGDWLELGGPQNGQVVNPPFEGWSLNGATGHADGKFLSWDVTENELICISTGLGTGENDSADFVAITIDPLTCEFAVQGESRSAGFFVHDLKSGQLTPVGQWLESPRLTSNLAIVAATTSDLSLAGKAVSVLQTSESAATGKTAGDRREQLPMVLCLSYCETKVEA
ncbi:MAG: GAF domain-containing protein [Planctomycetota bacterium]